MRTVSKTYIVFALESCRYHTRDSSDTNKSSQVYDGKHGGRGEANLSRGQARRHINSDPGFDTLDI